VNVPAVVGLPENWPEEFSTIPGGSCPATTTHRYGCTPPSANRFAAYDDPTVPGRRVELGLVMTSGRGASIVIARALVAVWPQGSFTCTVKLCVSIVVGVPVMDVDWTPNELAIVRPPGSLPAINLNV